MSAAATHTPRTRLTAAAAVTPAHSLTARTPLTAAPSASRTSTLASATVPKYEPPSAPLNAGGLAALNSLLSTYPLDSLNKSVKETESALSADAGDLHDALAEKAAVLERRAGKRKRYIERLREDRNSNEQDIDEAGEAAELESKTEHEQATLARERQDAEAMTTRIDAAVRKVIDAEAGLGQVQVALEEVQNAAQAYNNKSRRTAQAQSNAQSQNTDTQTQRSRRGRTSANDNDDDATQSSIAPTLPATIPRSASSTTLGRSEPSHLSESQEPVAAQLTTIFTEALERHAVRYTAQSLAHRYASSNTYKDFRRVVHEARHGATDHPPDLPPPSKWFAREEEPAPGVTGGSARAARTSDDEEDDDDIAIVRGNTSTRCPITFMEFTAPLSSVKCPHSFEAEAIRDMIRAAPLPALQPGQSRTDRARMVKCPAAGCEHMLAEADLREDPALVRRVRRIQRARELEEEEGRGRGRESRVMGLDREDIDSSSEDDEGEVLCGAPRVKREGTAGTGVATTATAGRRSEVPGDEIEEVESGDEGEEEGRASDSEVDEEMGSDEQMSEEQEGSDEEMEDE